ncbi:MAG: PTS sugar transporter subunit IIA [Calditrichaeota bacterium]|nr:MAG: PTS sugar transporter subunit IIA [Calditrichota bacterium]
MKLVDILSEETIKVPLENKEKFAIIEELVDTLMKADKILDRDKVLKAILDREAVMSTGVGDGVAIPHGKSDGAPNIVAALGVAPEPVDFQAIDNKPVQLIWLLIGPPGKTGPHLKALSRISRLMHKKEFRDRLIHASSASEILREVSREEEKYFEI